ncbi:CHY zinc finger protein [Corynebacterium occultum]|uniref:CHY zinc finger protein n=1 Tax=Corynebacterium occultum TaxID=2675219 RepID=UPI0018CED0DE|nr:CHY zinc finger protein [Corynebacterium occultum]
MAGKGGVVRGRGLDEQGRCAHYQSELDVIANRCATCGQWWACFQCHREQADHPFGRMPLDVPAARCGSCGWEMDYDEYSRIEKCGGCGHPFNPGCSAHAPLYFKLQ